jgi:hypothetical protein
VLLTHIELGDSQLLHGEKVYSIIASAMASKLRRSFIDCPTTCLVRVAFVQRISVVRYLLLGPLWRVCRTSP